MAAISNPAAKPVRAGNVAASNGRAAVRLLTPANQITIVAGKNARVTSEKAEKLAAKESRPRASSRPPRTPGVWHWPRYKHKGVGRQVNQRERDVSGQLREGLRFLRQPKPQKAQSHGRNDAQDAPDFGRVSPSSGIPPTFHDGHVPRSLQTGTRWGSVSQEYSHFPGGSASESEGLEGSQTLSGESRGQEYNQAAPIP